MTANGLTWSPKALQTARAIGGADDHQRIKKRLMMKTTKAGQSVPSEYNIYCPRPSDSISAEAAGDNLTPSPTSKKPAGGTSAPSQQANGATSLRRWSVSFCCIVCGDTNPTDHVCPSCRAQTESEFIPWGMTHQPHEAPAKFRFVLTKK